MYQAEKLESLISCTGAPREEALEVIRICGWDVAKAADRFFRQRKSEAKQARPSARLWPRACELAADDSSMLHWQSLQHLTTPSAAHSRASC